MGALSGRAAAGEEGAECGWRRPWGLRYHPHSHPQHPKPLPSSRSRIRLGPGFAEGFSSQVAPPQPPSMSGGGRLGSPVDQPPSGALGTRDPLALMLLCPPGIILAICLSSPRGSAWKSGALASAPNLGLQLLQDSHTLHLSPASRCGPRLAALWAPYCGRDRDVGHNVHPLVAVGREVTVLSVSCRGAWCPFLSPKLALLTSHANQAAPDLNRDSFQDFPYSPQPLSAGLSKLSLSYWYLLCALGHVTFPFRTSVS